MTDNIDKTIDRVRALLRKADENANPSEHERDAALAMAQKLMFKHGLDLGDIGELDDDARDREFVHDRDGSIKCEERWECTLAWKLAPYYFCRSYMLEFNRNYRVALIGRREHVAILREVFTYVRDQIRGMAAAEVAKRSGIPQQARQYVRRRWLDTDHELSEFDERLDEAITLANDELQSLDAGARADLIMRTNGCSVHYSKKVESHVRRGVVAPEYVENLTVWRNSFYDGATLSVAKRVREQQRDQIDEAPGTTGTDLVRNEDGAVAAFMDSLGLGLRSSRSNRRSDYSGRAAGDAAGSRADLGGRKVGGGRGQLTA